MQISRIIALALVAVSSSVVVMARPMNCPDVCVPASLLLSVTMDGMYEGIGKLTCSRI
jgi:hypothetical protein